MNHSYNLSASSGGNKYTLQVSVVPGAGGSFNGQSALSNTLSLNISENGTLISNDISTDYFIISPYTPLGAFDQSNGQMIVFANQTALPDLATVGESGPLDTFTTYSKDTGSGTTVYATGTETWTLDADTSTSALGCVDLTENLSAGGTVTDSTCYQLDERGNVLSMQITITENGVTLNFQ